jgi:predicted HTH domain antitoxin
MPAVIPDEVLQQAGLTEREALIEIACRLFETGKLPLWPAAQLAGLSRSHMEGELIARGIPVYRYTEEDLKNDLQMIQQYEAERGGRRQ